MERGRFVWRGHLEIQACLASSSPETVHLPASAAADFTCGSGRRPVTVRYLSLDLGNMTSALSLVGRMARQTASHVVGIILKSTEVAFQGGGASRRRVQMLLRQAVLSHANVLLQDTQARVPCIESHATWKPCTCI